jgi:hypothetical protein
MKTAVKKSKNINIVIPKSLIKEEDLVVMPRKEYEYMKASMIPTSYLKGKKAHNLDDRVNKALKEHKDGKTIRIKSLVDLI